MSPQRTKAIVLRRTSYGEADRILQLLTPEGKRAVMAKGVRREKSKLAGGIELFSVSDVVLGSGKGELGILRSARMEQFFGNILNDYDRLQFAYQAMKLVAAGSDSIDTEDWYFVLSSVLAALDNQSTDLRLIETWFLVRYTDILGEQINLHFDVTGQKLDPAKKYMYDEFEKSLRIAEQGSITAEHIKLLRLIEQKDLSVVAQIGGIDNVIVDCWLMARQHAGV